MRVKWDNKHLTHRSSLPFRPQVQVLLQNMLSWAAKCVQSVSIFWCPSDVVSQGTDVEISLWVGWLGGSHYAVKAAEQEASEWWWESPWKSRNGVVAVVRVVWIVWVVCSMSVSLKKPQWWWTLPRPDQKHHIVVNLVIPAQSRHHHNGHSLQKLLHSWKTKWHAQELLTTGG